MPTMPPKQHSGPPHYVDLHVNAGECVSLQLLDGQEQVVVGPATITMISQQQNPPVPIPVQVPPGHMIHQIADENGTLKHIILSVMDADDGVQLDSTVITLPQGTFRIDSNGELVSTGSTGDGGGPPPLTTLPQQAYFANYDSCPVAYDATTLSDSNEAMMPGTGNYSPAIYPSYNHMGQTSLASVLPTSKPMAQPAAYPCNPDSDNYVQRTPREQMSSYSHTNNSYGPQANIVGRSQHNENKRHNNIGDNNKSCSSHHQQHQHHHHHHNNQQQQIHNGGNTGRYGAQAKQQQQMMSNNNSNHLSPSSASTVAAMNQSVNNSPQATSSVSPIRQNRMGKGANHNHHHHHHHQQQSNGLRSGGGGVGGHYSGNSMSHTAQTNAHDLKDANLLPIHSNSSGFHTSGPRDSKQQQSMAKQQQPTTATTIYAPNSQHNSSVNISKHINNSSNAIGGGAGHPLSAQSGATCHAAAPSSTTHKSSAWQTNSSNKFNQIKNLNANMNQTNASEPTATITGQKESSPIQATNKQQQQQRLAKDSSEPAVACTREAPLSQNNAQQVVDAQQAPSVAAYEDVLDSRSSRGKQKKCQSNLTKNQTSDSLQPVVIVKQQSKSPITKSVSGDRLVEDGPLNETLTTDDNQENNNIKSPLAGNKFDEGSGATNRSDSKFRANGAPVAGGIKESNSKQGKKRAGREKSLSKQTSGKPNSTTTTTLEASSSSSSSSLSSTAASQDSKATVVARVSLADETPESETTIREESALSDCKTIESCLSYKSNDLATENSSASITTGPKKQTNNEQPPKSDRSDPQQPPPKSNKHNSNQKTINSGNSSSTSSSSSSSSTSSSSNISSGISPIKGDQSPARGNSKKSANSFKDTTTLSSPKLSSSGNNAISKANENGGESGSQASYTVGHQLESRLNDELENDTVLLVSRTESPSATITGADAHPKSSQRAPALTITMRTSFSENNIQSLENSGTSSMMKSTQTTPQKGANSLTGQATTDTGATLGSQPVPRGSSAEVARKRGSEKNSRRGSNVKSDQKLRLSSMPQLKLLNLNCTSVTVSSVQLRWSYIGSLAEKYGIHHHHHHHPGLKNPALMDHFVIESSSTKNPETNTLVAPKIVYQGCALTCRVNHLSPDKIHHFKVRRTALVTAPLAPATGISKNGNCEQQSTTLASDGTCEHLVVSEILSVTLPSVQQSSGGQQQQKEQQQQQQTGKRTGSKSSQRGPTEISLSLDHSLGTTVGGQSEVSYSTTSISSSSNHRVNTSSHCSNSNHNSHGSGSSKAAVSHPPIKFSNLYRQCRTKFVAMLGKVVQNSLSSYSDTKFAGLLLVLFTIFAMLLAIFIHLYIVAPVTE